MKKWIAMILALVMVLSMVACSNSSGRDDDDDDEEEIIREFVAEDYDEVGTCGEDAQWGFKEETGELVIIGTGEIDPSSGSSLPWSELDVKSVSIYGVTSIGDHAFLMCESLTEVLIGDSVQTIGVGAFSYCRSLSELTIGNSVQTIGEGAFNFCESLTEVTIPDSVTTIGAGAFSSGCYQMTGIYADNAAYQDIDGVLYTTDKKTLVQYPAGRKERSYTIPDSVQTIESYAFQWCDGLTEVVIGDSVQTIGLWAFDGCENLTEITIPDSMLSIGMGAFAQCDSLADVYYGGTEEQWNAIKIADMNDPLIEATIHFNS